ncbi:MAG TPA: ferritin-like domain-containing protein [Polyangiaceae bacterium]|nr:ferritin-like domain-containing protein [Polyangiaceae bacterium]
MFGHTWLAYFQANARRDCAPAPCLFSEVPAALRGPLAVSLGRFQLGESAGGRIHEEMSGDCDAALDAKARRSIQLYIEEEWRHARELSMVIAALGGELQKAHWTNGAFTACRRLLGLRTKMMTLAIAEVVGIVYYRALARGIGSPALATSLERIAGEESEHLDFQAAFFEHAIALCPAALRAPYRWLLQAQMLAIFVAALAVLLLDHGRVLRGARTRYAQVVRGAWKELRGRHFLSKQRPRVTVKRMRLA